MGWVGPRNLPGRPSSACRPGVRGTVRTPRVVAVVCVGAAAVGWWAGAGHRSAREPWAVVAVVDGDTIVVARSEVTRTVRLLGVDTPETHHPTKGVECFGPEAARFTRRSLEGEQVHLEGDVEPHDVYGRTLAYVYVDGERFNDVLLRRGFARLLVIPPNRAHGRVMLDAELRARDEQRGLWRSCPED